MAFFFKACMSDLSFLIVISSIILMDLYKIFLFVRLPAIVFLDVRLKKDRSPWPTDAIYTKEGYFKWTIFSIIASIEYISAKDGYVLW